MAPIRFFEHDEKPEPISNERKARIVSFMRHFEKTSYPFFFKRMAFLLVTLVTATLGYRLSANYLQCHGSPALFSWAPTSLPLALLNTITVILLLYVRGLAFDPLHDAVHNAHLPTPRENAIVFWFMSAFLLHSPTIIITEHLQHHSFFDNLSRWRGHVESCPWTLKQFQEASFFKKISYTIEFGLCLGGFKEFYTSCLRSIASCFLRPRKNWPYGAWILSYYLILYKIHPSLPLLDLIAVLIAYQFTWIFFVHGVHTFDQSYRKHTGEWRIIDASLYGSCYIDVPWIFHFLMGPHISFHNLHHVNPRVPSYRFQECYDAAYELMAKEEKEGVKTRLFPPFYRVDSWALIWSLAYMVYDEDSERFLTLYDVLRRPVGSKVPFVDNVEKAKAQ